MSVIIITTMIRKYKFNTYYCQKLLVVLLTLQLIFPIESHDDKREEVRKKFETNDKRGVACCRYVFLILPNPPLPSPSHILSQCVILRRAWKMTAVFFQRYWSYCFKLQGSYLSKIPSIPMLLWISGFSSTCDVSWDWFSSMNMSHVIKHSEHEIPCAHVINVL